MSRAENWTDTDLSDFDQADEKPDWTPLQDADEKSRVNCIVCQKCGAEHDPDVGRVIGNNDDELVRGCFDCSTGRELMGITDRYGAGAGTKGGL